MSDLFSPSITNPRSAEEVRKSAQEFRTSNRGPIVEVRKCGSALLSVRTEEKCGALPQSRILLQAPASGPKHLGLLEQRSSLENEIEEIEAQTSAANAEQEPYRAAFKAAHGALEMLHQRRQSGASVAKAKMLEAYDDRTLAGYDWHPYRKKFEDLQRFLKLLREELKAVNKEIGT